MTRGEIWWVSLGAPRGSAPGFIRPAVIVQSDRFNSTGISTIVVAIITAQLKRGEAPGNVVITPRESGLPKPSVVNVSQLLSVERADFTRRVGSLSARRMAEIDAGLRLVLSLQ